MYFFSKYIRIYKYILHTETPRHPLSALPLFQKILQLFVAAGVPELAQRFCFYLTAALPGHLKLTAHACDTSIGAGASSSGIKSHKWLSTSQPMEVPSDTGFLAILIISRTLSSVILLFLANSPVLGSCPYSCNSCRFIRYTLAPLQKSRFIRLEALI